MKAPDEADVANAGWALGVGHDFWSYVDSQPRYNPMETYGHPEECKRGWTSPNCGVWAHQRGNTHCVAALSTRDRCSRPLVTGTPFCRRHLAKALEVLLVAVVEDEREMLRHRLDWAREDAKKTRTQTLIAMGLETALLIDATTAASVLPERVYFFAVDHAVKIGRSVKPEQRVKSLSATKAPENVDVRAGYLLGTIPGGYRVEGELHQRFRSHRLVGEWFALEPIRVDISALLEERAAA